MGVVYAGRDDSLGRQIAIKVITPAAADDADAMARFRLEARVLAALDHPAILPVYAYGEQDGEHYFVAKLVDGRPLTPKLVEAAGGFVDALPKLRPIFEALDYAHGKGVLHRDLKPGNVLLRDDGTPVVIDFGLAKQAAATALTEAGMRMGTPVYMSPEQAEGLPDPGPATDQYSLGVMVYELLAGRPPFLGESVAILLQHLSREPEPVTSFNADVPPALCAAVRRALAKAPADRYPDCMTFWRALAQTVGAAGASPPPLPPRRVDRAESVAIRGPSRRPWLLLAGAVVLAFAAAGMAWWLLGRDATPPPPAEAAAPEPPEAAEEVLPVVEPAPEPTTPPPAPPVRVEVPAKARPRSAVRPPKASPAAAPSAPDKDRRKELLDRLRLMDPDP